MTGPSFDDLVGTDLPAEERARLERVHELLVAAGPPPELSPRLTPPVVEQKARVIPIRRGRVRTTAFAAAATLLLAFGAGWLFGNRHDTGHVEVTVAMAGPNGAQASLEVLSVDKAGNWPMRMHVSGLPVLPAGRTYTLWLTKKGAPESPCGTFTVGGGTTNIDLNAPYRLHEYSGWIVVVTGTTKPLLSTATV